MLSWYELFPVFSNSMFKIYLFFIGIHIPLSHCQCCHGPGVEQGLCLVSLHCTDGGGQRNTSSIGWSCACGGTPRETYLSPGVFLSWAGSHYTNLSHSPSRLQIMGCSRSLLATWEVKVGTDFEWSVLSHL